MIQNSTMTDTIGKYRWTICTLLLFATTINYMDRQVIGYLKEFFCSSTEKGGFGWTNSNFANVTAFFTLFYATTTIFAGWVVDKIGTKRGLAISLVIWSVFGITNAFVGQLVIAHVIIRSLFGIGEAGNFPSSIKTVAEWFPKKERALATGIFNSGSNIGAMIAALAVPTCLIVFGDQLGWKMAYIITGVIGFVWLFFWFAIYDTPAVALSKKRITQKEFDYIHSDDIGETAAEKLQRKEAVSWFKLFNYKQTWSFFFGKFVTDGVWWFYLFWLPDYLKKQFGMTKSEVMIPTFIVYGVAILGSIYGGRIPMKLMDKGWHVYKARMSALLIIALFPLIVLATQYFGDKMVFGHWASTLAVATICIGAAAHQAWSANLFTTVSDMFPKKAVASVTGIGAAAGGLGGFIIQKMAGGLTDAFADRPQIAYSIMFVMCALSYLLAWGIMKALVPQHKPITDI